MKVFGYARRSTAERKKTNYSIESQKDVCEIRAKQDGRIIQKWFIDEGYSGTKIDRPDLQKMLKEIAMSHGEPIIVYVWITSRLSRDVNHCHSLRYVFQKYNVTIISCENEWITLEETKNSPDKAIGPLMINIVDNMEVHRDAVRTRRGLITSAKKGNYTKGGRFAPIGWKFVYNSSGKGRKVELDYLFVETIIYICEQIHDYKRSVDSIALELNSKKECGISWSYNKVYKIVTNPLLYGRFITGYCDINNHSPSYMTKKYFDEMQKVMHGRKKETRHKYLFKNLVKCHKCDCLCSEIPTIHYSIYKNKNTKRIYKYYYCPKCKRRINEDIVLKEMIIYIQEINNEIINKEVHNKYKLQEKRIEKRLSILNEEFEEGYLLEELYRKERAILLKKIKNIRKNIKKFENSLIKKFNDYSYLEQKDIIRKTFKCISIDLKNKEVHEIYNCDSCLTTNN